jgi:hypothetical protein
MAKGSLAKEEITKKILNDFEGSFINEKEIRIPWEENGEQVQIKITLTCAKVNIENPGSNNAFDIAGTQTSAPATGEIPDLTQEEKNKINNLIEKLGL